MCLEVRKVLEVVLLVRKANDILREMAILPGVLG